MFHEIARALSDLPLTTPRVQMAEMINVTQDFSTDREWGMTWNVQQWPNVGRNRALQHLKVGACFLPLS
jgi:hypothetical protein